MTPELSSSVARTIVVTGGGSGIGRSVSLLCARRGDRVAILDKNAEAAMMTAGAIGNSDVLALGCDVTSENEVERAFAEISSRLGTPYGVFANAGIDIGGFVHELPLTTWRTVLETNLTGIFLTCKHALKQMLANGTGGSIVCTSSPTGSVALAAGACAAYSSSKAGISALVRCMAIDYAAYAIRVNAIVPGATETPLMWNNVDSKDREAIRTRISKEIPLGRLADPEEPARMVLWLLSDESSYVTGANMVCDGGILAKASISV